MSSIVTSEEVKKSFEEALTNLSEKEQFVIQRRI
jgi:DNA-directed RNA polymerase sigma subunit (sigma70/sigma32)